jgi:N-acetylmuramoyl-L-alanine amidase
MKKILVFIITTVLFLGTTCGVLASEIDSRDKTQDPLIIVLDPGHDKDHGGARGNGLSEMALNLKIAQYCYEELCTYSNVEVYMTRNSSECPHPEDIGKTNGARLDNLKRVDFAEHLGADVYVALHLNSYTDSSIHGAMVFVPNNNYRPQIGKEGTALGHAIQKELVKLGLKDQGISIRGSEDGTHYEDGSLADYYGVIKRAKDADIPGIIIEHCFISSPKDAANHLSTEEQLKALGVADATGIAKYYGLEKTGKTLTPDEIHKVKFVKDGKLVYTQYVRHGQDAWILDEELIEAVNITYGSSLSNITKDTTIQVDFDPVGTSSPEPDPEPDTETESEDASDTETESDSTTETDVTETTESEMKDSSAEEETTTQEDTEVVGSQNHSDKNVLQDALKYGAGFAIGLILGCLVTLGCVKKKNKEE